MVYAIGRWPIGLVLGMGLAVGVTVSTGTQSIIVPAESLGFRVAWFVIVSEQTRCYAGMLDIIRLLGGTSLAIGLADDSIIGQ